MGKKDLYRRGSGPLFFVTIAVLIYALYSLTIAGVTAEKCDGQGREWNIVPPRWECTGRPGFG